MEYQSPLQVDDPLALYRVNCPVCRDNVWAGYDEPPASGDDILAEHDCPGPIDLNEDAAQQELALPRMVLPEAADGDAPTEATVVDDPPSDQSEPLAVLVQEASSGRASEPAPDSAR